MWGAGSAEAGRRRHGHCRAQKGISRVRSEYLTFGDISTSFVERRAQFALRSKTAGITSSAAESGIVIFVATVRNRMTFWSACSDLPRPTLALGHAYYLMQRVRNGLSMHFNLRHRRAGPLSARFPAPIRLRPDERAPCGLRVSVPEPGRGKAGSLRLHRHTGRSSGQIEPVPARRERKGCGGSPVSVSRAERRRVGPRDFRLHANLI